jgi:curved DNA-binding protein CbpA
MTDFVDFYELLQISPNAQLQTIQRVFKMLAMRCHPDNPETGDTNRFLKITQAYETLSDPRRRGEYDALYVKYQEKPAKVFETKDFEIGVDGEANRRMGILCLLYARRRTDPDAPGISLFELEGTMALAREHLMFALWYLKERDLARMDHSGDFAITGVGVDFVEQNLPQNKLMYHLLKAAEEGSSRTAAPEDAPQD